MPPRAIGIVRVSRTAGREGESFASPAEQAQRIRTACQRDGLDLLEIVEELDVSGGKDLDARPGLGPAVHAVEEGRADVIVGAYFDRLFRSLRAQGECVERVEQAGGRVLAVDVGRVTNESAGQWLSGTMLGAVSEYQRRTTAERTRDAQQRAISRGAAPWPRVTAGYRRRDDGTLEPDPATAPHVREAFEMRAAGATVRAARDYLQAHGILLTYAGAVKLLTSRVVLGEIHFGKYTPNLSAHDPIVDRSVWAAVQRARVPSGRNTKSERLLARLGILRCGTCDSKLVANTAIGASSATYPIYRCQNTDCPRRVTIAAGTAEKAVVAAVRRELADVAGRASIAERVTETVAARDRAQSDLDTAIRVLAIVGDEPAAVERLEALVLARDEAQARVDEFAGAAEVTLTIDDWDALSFDEQRGLIRSAISRAVVDPGRGVGRVRVEALR